jgi:RHS repeat-associated protein
LNYIMKKIIWVLFLILIILPSIFGSKTVYYFSDYHKEDGKEVKYYASPNGRIMRKDNEVYYIITDHLGSSTIVTDSEGNEIGNITYYPYGDTFSESEYIPTERKYTGQIKDESTELYYYNARYYNPITGRFISADKAGDGYTYAGNNPIMFSDPSGNIVVSSGGPGNEGGLLTNMRENWRRNTAELKELTWNDVKRFGSITLQGGPLLYGLYQDYQENPPIEWAVNTFSPDAESADETMRKIEIAEFWFTEAASVGMMAESFGASTTPQQFADMERAIRGLFQKGKTIFVKVGEKGLQRALAEALSGGGGFQHVPLDEIGVPVQTEGKAILTGYEPLADETEEYFQQALYRSTVNENRGRAQSVVFGSGLPDVQRLKINSRLPFFNGPFSEYYELRIIDDQVCIVQKEATLVSGRPASSSAIYEWR